MLLSPVISVLFKPRRKAISLPLFEHVCCQACTQSLHFRNDINDLIQGEARSFSQRNLVVNTELNISYHSESASSELLSFSFTDSF